MRGAASTLNIQRPDLLDLPPSKSLGSLSSRLSSTSSFHSVFSEEDLIKEVPDKENDHVGIIEANDYPPDITSDLVMTSCKVHLIPKEELADLVIIIMSKGSSPAPSMSALSDIVSSPPPTPGEEVAQLEEEPGIDGVHWVASVPASDTTHMNARIVVT